MKKYFTFYLIALLALITVNGQVDLNSGLVGYFKLDEGEGTTTANSATGGNVAPDGTLQNDPVWVEGVYGMALEFDNSSTAHVTMGTFDPTLGGNELTVSAWLYWTGIGAGGWHGVCGKRDGWTDSPFMWDIATIENSGILQFEVNVTDGKHVVESAQPPAENDWTHMVLTFDGTTAKFYLNGVKDSEGEMLFGEGRDAGLTLGCAEMGGSHSFSGKIDEFRLYNRALTDDEVAALYIFDPTQVGIENLTSNDSENNLYQNYPNPFTSNTTIYYNLGKPGMVQMTLYDYCGKEIKSLVNKYISTKSNSVTVDGSNLPEGIYFYELKVDSEVINTKKMLLLK